ncbi:TRAP transporter small permease [Evansella tamaricis]|uniref:TRAP transporter small permease n=1 Tax=Evansella tamaricis TaxID=2069301 RepID=A0ABS6JFY5_9BACI|nr:TRAP transporter small permease [Evansella tamaricis]MBU9712558.1 TRAP transporter small permease [Evansella tamaricis]
MDRAKKWWALTEDLLAGTFLTVGITLILYGALMRYVFSDPKAWVMEISTYSIVWGVLLGVPIAWRNNQHIRIDILYDKLSGSKQRLMDIFSNGVCVIFCIAFTYYGLQLVIERYPSGMTSMDVGIPMWIVYLVLPISGFLFLLRSVEKLVIALKGEGEK